MEACTGTCLLYTYYIYPDENLDDFTFFEASSIRKIGNKYILVYSGMSGPEYGVDSNNSSLRYCYGDSPMGPWRSGGVLIDSRGPVPNKDGTGLETHGYLRNTHGSILEDVYKRQHTILTAVPSNREAGESTIRARSGSCPQHPERRGINLVAGMTTRN